MQPKATNLTAIMLPDYVDPKLQSRNRCQSIIDIISVSHLVPQKKRVTK